MNILGQLGFCFALLLIFGIPAYLWSERAKRKKIEAAFADRERLDAETFYERYFQSEGVPKEIVCKIKQILEEELGADLSRLKGSDDFSQNLKFFWDYDSLADVEIVLRLEEAFKIAITNEEAGQTKTVADIANLVWRKMQQQNV